MTSPDRDHEEDCGCAACDTLIMRGDPDWKPTVLPPGTRGTCVFCRQYAETHHLTRLAMNVCVSCNATLTPRTA